MFFCVYYVLCITICLSLAGQTETESASDLRARIEASPVLAFHPIRFDGNRSKSGAVSSVAVARDGTIYELQRGNRIPPVLALDRAGRVLRSWGAGDFTIAHTIRIDLNGNIWTIDAASSRIIEYSTHGKTLLKFIVGEQAQNGSSFKGATDIAIAKNGHIFVTDGYGNARVLEYSKDGKRLNEWGHSGSGPGDFNLPHSIQIDERGTIYIADRENGRIEEFDLNGKYLREISHLGRIYSIRLSSEVIWATMEPFDQEPGSGNCWLIQLDRRTGKLLGHLNITEPRAGHSVDVTPTGEPIITAGNEVLMFKANTP